MEPLLLAACQALRRGDEGDARCFVALFPARYNVAELQRLCCAMWRRRAGKEDDSDALLLALLLRFPALHLFAIQTCLQSILDGDLSGRAAAHCVWHVQRHLYEATCSPSERVQQCSLAINTCTCGLDPQQLALPQQLLACMDVVAAAVACLETLDPELMSRTLHGLLDAVWPASLALPLLGLFLDVHACAPASVRDKLHSKALALATSIDADDIASAIRVSVRFIEQRGECRWARVVRRLWAAVPRSLERTLVALVQEVLRAAGAARGALGRDIEDDAIWLVRADALRNPFVREHLRDETRSLTDSDVRLLLLLLSPTRAEAHAQRALLVCLLALARAQEPSSPLAAGLGAVALRIVASACPGPLGDDYLAVERACVLAQWAFAVSADAQQLSHCCSAVCGSALAPSVADVLLAVLASACSCFPRMQRGVFNDALARYALLCQELCADAKTRLQKAFLVELMGALCRGADAESLDIEGALLSLLSLSVQDQRDPVLALAPLVCAHSTHAAALLVLPLNKHLRGDAAARAYALLALFRLLPSADDLLQVEIGRILLQYCAQTAGVRRSLTSQLLEVMMQDLQEKRLCAGLLSLVLSHVAARLSSFFVSELGKFSLAPSACYSISGEAMTLGDDLSLLLPLAFVAEVLLDSSRSPHSLLKRENSSAVDMTSDTLSTDAYLAASFAFFSEQGSSFISPSKQLKPGATKQAQKALIAVQYTALKGLISCVEIAELSKIDDVMDLYSKSTELKALLDQCLDSAVRLDLCLKSHRIFNKLIDDKFFSAPLVTTSQAVNPPLQKSLNFLANIQLRRKMLSDDLAQLKATEFPSSSCSTSVAALLYDVHQLRESVLYARGVDDVTFFRSAMEVVFGAYRELCSLSSEGAVVAAVARGAGVSLPSCTSIDAVNARRGQLMMDGTRVSHPKCASATQESVVQSLASLRLECVDCLTSLLVAAPRLHPMLLSSVEDAAGFFPEELYEYTCIGIPARMIAAVAELLSALSMHSMDSPFESVRGKTWACFMRTTIALGDGISAVSCILNAAFKLCGWGLGAAMCHCILFAENDRCLYNSALERYERRYGAEPLDDDEDAPEIWGNKVWEAVFKETIKYATKAATKMSGFIKSYDAFATSEKQIKAMCFALNSLFCCSLCMYAVRESDRISESSTTLYYMSSRLYQSSMTDSGRVSYMKLTEKLLRILSTVLLSVVKASSSVLKKPDSNTLLQISGILYKISPLMSIFDPFEVELLVNAKVTLSTITTSVSAVAILVESLLGMFSDIETRLSTLHGTINAILNKVRDDLPAELVRKADSLLSLLYGARKLLGGVKTGSRKLKNLKRVAEEEYSDDEEMLGADESEAFVSTRRGGRSRHSRTRSRNPVIDAWLAVEGGVHDSYADLEDFIVDN